MNSTRPPTSYSTSWHSMALRSHTTFSPPIALKTEGPNMLPKEGWWWVIVNKIVLRLVLEKNFYWLTFTLPSGRLSGPLVFEVAIRGESKRDGWCGSGQMTSDPIWRNELNVLEWCEVEQETWGRVMFIGFGQACKENGEEGDIWVCIQTQILRPVC
jgi:hypothetical protein